MTHQANPSVPVISYSRLGFNGRLGNQLWQIASTFAIARHQNAEPRFPPWEYQPVFSCPLEWFDGERGPDAELFADRIHPLSRSYLQATYLLAGFEAAIKTMFASSDWAQAQLDNYVPDELKMAHPRIGLHVRRTDVVEKPWANPPCTVEYYQRALSELPPDAPVLICTDDRQWCEQQLIPALGRNTWLAPSETRVAADWIGAAAYSQLAPPRDWLDLFVLRDCDHHVIANSSFSWWAARLSEDPAPFYPLAWYGERLIPYNDVGLIIPSGWRGR